MDGKPPHGYTAHLAWIIPAMIALLGIVLDHLDMASALLSKIWQLFFVNIWYLWMVAAGYGLYRFVRLTQNLHNLTHTVLPNLMNADAGNLIQTLKAVEKESACRVSADDSLSHRINSLDTRTLDDRETLRKELRAEFSQAIQKETRDRAEQIAAVKKRLSEIELSPSAAPTKDSPYKGLINRAGIPGVGESAVSAALLGTTPRQDGQNATLAALHEIERKKPS